MRSNANISYKIHFFFGEKILVALDTYAKKMNPPSIVLGGVHGKVCWLIAYIGVLQLKHGRLIIEHLPAGVSPNNSSGGTELCNNFK